MDNMGEKSCKALMRAIEKSKQRPLPQVIKSLSLPGIGAHIGKALAENATEALRHVWLCHLSEENNHPELARKTVEQILRSYGIVAGKDFMLEVLKRKTPSEIYTLKATE